MGLPNPAWVSLANLVSHMEIWATKDKTIYCSALKFRQKCQPQIHLEMFVELFAPMGEIVEQKGTSCRLLVLTPLKSLWLPNEDFGTMNKRWNEHFLSTFQWFMAQIEYSRPWKVLRKSAFHLLFILPKSSFGEHKVLPSKSAFYLLFPQTKFWDGYVFEGLYAPQTKILEGLTIVVFFWFWTM